ncbi:Csu type fimbrial protein [Erwinia aphidicola]|uniref:Csu type fimbrial protein n=1 Tax=Erwinia aphidicola TaxID=68334 RepID=UPI003CEFB40D
MRHSIYFLIVLLAGLLGLPCVQASCTTISANSSFGNVSSFVLAGSAQIVESGSGFTCSGSLLSLASTNTITATVASSAHASGNQPQLYGAESGSYVPYSLCSDSSCASTYHSGDTITWRSTSLLGLLGLFNSSDGSLPLYLRTITGVNVPAGFYNDTITLNWKYHICFVGVLGVCVYTDGTATSTLNVSLQVSNDCYLDSAPDVNFGSAALPGQFSTISNSLSVRCTRNATYTINLSGVNPVRNEWRQMAGVSGGKKHFLQYKINKNDGSAWGPDNDLTVVGSGSSQTIPYSANINPEQTGQPSGVYSETVTVTIGY